MERVLVDALFAAAFGALFAAAFFEGFMRTADAGEETLTATLLAFSDALAAIA